MYEKTIEFIKELYGNPEFVPLSVPKFIGNEKKYLEECIDTTFVSSVGAFVDRFEKDMATFTGAKKAVVCVSGTNALHMAMMLAGVERGDEVITQALTFIATCNAISYIGANPVFVDVDKTTMGLSPDAVRNWLVENAEIRAGQCYNKKTGRRVKACVPMHTFGHPVRIEDLAVICAEWHLELVEDAAESIGSRYKGKHTGLFGKVGVLSFNGNKTITTGGGGMLLFMDESLAAMAKHLTTQAKVPHRWEFKHDHVGYNYRMPNINAALGCAQLEHLDEFIADKRETAKAYARYFKDTDGIIFFTEPEDCFSNYWLNAVILPDHDAQQRFLLETNDNGVMTRPIWELMNRLSMFESCQRDSLKRFLTIVMCMLMAAGVAAQLPYFAATVGRDKLYAYTSLKARPGINSQETYTTFQYGLADCLAAGTDLYTGPGSACWGFLVRYGLTLSKRFNVGVQLTPSFDLSDSFSFAYFTNALYLNGAITADGRLFWCSNTWWIVNKGAANTFSNNEYLGYTLRLRNGHSITPMAGVIHSWLFDRDIDLNAGFYYTIKNWSFYLWGSAFLERHPRGVIGVECIL